MLIEFGNQNRVSVMYVNCKVNIKWIFGCEIHEVVTALDVGGHMFRVTLCCCVIKVTSSLGLLIQNAIVHCHFLQSENLNTVSGSCVCDFRNIIYVLKM